MTILEIILGALAKASGQPVDALKGALGKLDAAAPDLAPADQAALAALTESATPGALLDLAHAILGEAKDMAGGKFSGRFHPGDAA
jgi:hypothetical protein